MNKTSFIIAVSLLVCIGYGRGICQEMPIQNIEQASNKVTLDIKGMDILDVLKILSMKSGLNIVAGKNVTGRVTIFLKDVDIWDALQIIMVANSLAYEKQGSIINVMTDRDYELIYGEKFYDKKRVHIVKLQYARAAEISKVLMQAKTNIGKVITDEGSNTLILVDVPSSILQMKQMIGEIDVPTETKVFSLQYAKAEDIEKKITEMVTKNLGIVKLDVRTNKLVVTDTPVQIEKIGKIIAAFDQKDAQVMIEAKILDIKLTDEFKFGIDWEVIAHKYLKLTQNLNIGVTDGGMLKIGTLAGGGNPQVAGEYSGLIDALRKIGDVNVLSSPRITTLNNQESKILVGTKDAYITSSTSQTGETAVTAQSVNFVDTGIKLYVTPTINDDKFITMKIKPEVSTAERRDVKSEDKKTEIPIVSTTEAETTVMVKDGTTIVLAGLIKDDLNKTVQKMPLLGSIPIIGRIFSNDSNVKEKREIVILLTPHIVTGESTFIETEKWQRYENTLVKIKDRIEKEDEVIKMQKEKAQRINQKMQEKQKEKKQQEAKKQKGASKPKEKEEESGVEQEEIQAGQLQTALRLGAQNDAFREAALGGSDYDGYFLNMKRKIHNAIRRNFSGLELKGEGVISFVLDAGGNLQGEPLVISEDNKMIGDVMIEGVKLASPFAAFPAAFDAQQEKFTVTLSFQ